MINRSTNISARHASNSNGNIKSSGGGNTVVLHDNESSKVKLKNSIPSSRGRSLALPMVITSLVLLVILHFGLLLPASSSVANKSKRRLRAQQAQNNDALIIPTNSKYRLTPRNQFPKGWKHLSYNNMRRHLNCRARTKDMNKPLPSLDDWNFMRQAYAHLIANHHHSDSTSTIKLPWEHDIVPPTLGYSLNPGIPVPPPYHAKLSPGKGRGLFASRDIHKGELVHDGTISDIIFPNDMAFRTFVFSLPSNLNCDALEWVWMQQLEHGGEYQLLMGINISSLMNSGGKDWNDVESKTVNCMPEDEYSGKFYATRSIGRGEEILTDYDIYYTKWSLVGLG